MAAYGIPNEDTLSGLGEVVSTVLTDNPPSPPYKTTALRTGLKQDLKPLGLVSHDSC